MSGRNHIDGHMINNIRIHARKKKIELENADIEIGHKDFDTSFIMTYRDISNNYTEGKFITVILFGLFS